MGNPFEFATAGRLVFGAGQFDRVGELTAGLGRTALICTNADRSGEAGLHKRLQALLVKAGVRHHTVWLRAEPRLEDVEAALDTACTMEADVLLSVGGGSAMDLAKAVAGLLANGGAPLDYLEVVGGGRKFERPATPHVAVPTTAGTGAEVTRNAVIACPEQRVKASMRSHHLLPSVALVDPELGRGVALDVASAAAMDALTQLLEAFVSRRATPFTDVLALEGLRRAGRSIRRAVQDGSPEAREDLAMAATLSGACLANAGLGAVHGFAASLGGLYDAPHGAVCAALLPHVIWANLEAMRAADPKPQALARYAEAGRAMTGRPDLKDDEAGDAARRFAEDLVREFRIPPLRMHGFAEGDVAKVVEQATKSSSMQGNPVELTPQTLGTILRRAL